MAAPGDQGALASPSSARVAVAAVRTRAVDSAVALDAFTGGLPHRPAGHGLLGDRLSGLTLAQVAHTRRFTAEVMALTCTVATPTPRQPPC